MRTPTDLVRTRRTAAKTTAVAALVLTALSACSDGGESSSAPQDPASTAPTDEASTPDDSLSAGAEDPAADGSAASSASGTYSATGGYRSPGGQQEVAVSVTLDNGVITAVEVTPQASDATSQAFQEDFAANVADQVVGKALADAKVSKVSGSSLTSQGFNAALDEIAAEAGA
ncbi:hypothetical protein GCM10010401_11200 [Rarobacter faecitabidus]|uniref:FMN-binding protein n=1 Tax=Rarobacter faecitabidus TaxID=13243 RepID=A0A542ZPH5_RARFA|nr:FMN-binding protein [Rarobacter faecitabidus]TQL62139.1 FMN-binding protein [Rarobacter faecitabidus]